MPVNIKDEEIADNCAEYFLKKIDKIRNDLADKPNFFHIEHILISLQRFDTITEEGISK